MGNYLDYSTVYTMKFRTIYRNKYIRPLVYAPMILAGMYTAHFAADLLTPMQTTDADRIQAAEYLVDNNLPTPPRPFMRDGCTLWPDQFPGHDFNDACLKHDIAYWAGGSRELQKQVNKKFRQDVNQVGPLGPVFGFIMYTGVTWFGNNGVSRVINSHWGFGWD